jgi:hypothetical protein
MQAITSRTQLVKGIMQRCNDCIGHKKVMMSGRALFRHPQSVIVSYWCMRHNAKLGDHVTRSCSSTSATSNHTRAPRRRDEPLGQAFAAQGRTELSSRGTGQRQCNSLQAQISPWRRPATSPPPDSQQTSKRKNSTQHKPTLEKRLKKKTNSKKGMKVRKDPYFNNLSIR